MTAKKKQLAASPTTPAAAAVERPESRQQVAAIAVGLIAMTLLVYGRTAVEDFSFLQYDDQQYVFENPRVTSGLTWSNVAWAFNPSTRVVSNWHPLTMLSHMLDCTLFGLNAGMHHATNVAWHVVNVLLLFAVLRQMTGAIWRSALVAALFSWHPLHVESVAWVAERKDLLCAFFWFVGMWCYVGYARRPGVARHLTVGLCIVLGFLSKPMIVTFPLAMLLLDYWPLERFGVAVSDSQFARRSFGRLLAEKIPWLVLVAIFCLIVISTQRRTIAGLAQLSLEQRFANAALAYDYYLWQTVWPVGLASPYPLELKQLTLARGLLALAPLVAISVAAVLVRRRFPYLLVGWFWFLGTLIPVIGLVQVGSQGRADRYTYIPAIGLFSIVAWALGDLATLTARLKRPAIAMALLMLLVLAGLAFRQVGYWRDTITLFSHTLAITGPNMRAHYGLARALESERRYDEALAQCDAMLRLKPNHFEAFYVQGLVYRATNRPGESARAFANAVRNGRGHLNAAQYIQLSNLAARTLAAHPDEKVRDAELAVQMAEIAAKLTQYSLAEVLDTLAAAYANSGRFSEAVARADRAQKIAAASGKPELAARIAARVQLYRQGRPFRDDPVKSQF